MRECLEVTDTPTDRLKERQLFAKWLREGRLIPDLVPDDLLERAARYLEGKRNKRLGSKHALQHWIIGQAVERLVDEEMTASRDKYNPPISACDVVTEVLDTLGIPKMSYENVRKIWRWYRNIPTRIPQ